MQSVVCTSWAGDMVFLVLCSVNVDYIDRILDVKPTPRFWHQPSWAASVWSGSALV